MEPRIVFLKPKSIENIYQQCNNGRLGFPKHCFGTSPPPPRRASSAQQTEMERRVGLVSVVSNNKANNSIHNGNNTNNISSTSGGVLMQPPPTFSRLPPDGHEFPPNFNEPLQMTTIPTIVTNRHSQIGETKRVSSLGDDCPALPKTAAPTIHPVKSKLQGFLKTSNITYDENDHGAVLSSSFVDMRRKTVEAATALSPATPTSKRSPLAQKKAMNWRKDEKSEKSVRDKIAMFSSPDTNTSSPGQQLSSGLRKSLYRSTDDLISSGPKIHLQHNYLSHLNGSHLRNGDNLAKKAKSVENLDDVQDEEEIPKYRSTKKIRDVVESSAFRPVFEKTQSVEVLNLGATVGGSLTMGMVTDEVNAKYASLPRRTNPPPNPTLLRTTSLTGYDYNQNVDQRRRSSINNILEQRKKSMSKLRGLIIPEKSAGFEVKADTVLYDLPEIRSVDLEKVSSHYVTPTRTAPLQPLPNERKFISNGHSEKKPASFQPPTVETPYHSIFEANRRTFGSALGSNLSSPKVQDPNKLSPSLPPTKPPRTSLIFNNRSPVPVDDSEDSDSLFSTQSSRISTPPRSPVALVTPVPIKVEKLPLTRTLSSETNSSTTSTLTTGSGSQASCSSIGSGPILDNKRKVIKNSSSGDGMNRKTILASAKSRNGNCKGVLEDSIGPMRSARAVDDEDSTDGCDEDQMKRPKPKQRNSLVNGKVSNGTNGTQLTNYKLVKDPSHLVDQVVNVATFVEVVEEPMVVPDVVNPSTNGYEMKSVINSTNNLIIVEAQSTLPPTPPKVPPPSYTVEAKKRTFQPENELNDLAKWVRTEAAKSSQVVDGHDSETTIPSPTSNRPVPRSLAEPKKLSTADLRKQFELKSASSSPVAKPSTPAAVREKTNNYHDRFSSWESVASNSSSGISSMPTNRSIPNSETAQSTPTDFGSFTSIGSSHSLLTAQDLQAIIEEADPPLRTPEAFVIVLQRETPESSIGITLAGGADYEAKEITVHKVLMQSPAEKDGRLKKGDRILAINGLSMRGLTHRESVTVLKTPRPEVVLAVTRSPSVISTPSLTKSKRPSLGSLASLLEKDDSAEMKKGPSYHKASRSLDLDAVGDGDSICSADMLDERSTPDKDETIDGTIPASFKKILSTPDGAREVDIVKDSCGLGFSIEGGFDSPLGNCPLTVKKIFMGGAAEKSGVIRSGNEIVAINGYSANAMTRVAAWNYMKKLPLGPVRIVIL